ncbi:MAG: hypothetical protein DIU68_007430 [Chloroflexota bacterium]|nr:MAG: hypothetical protein DIU68_13955 [Chloroflexota bacterium]
MTDTTSYDVQTDMRGQQDQTSMLIGLLVLGLVIGGAVAFFVAQANRKRRPQTLVGRIESGFEEGLESTAATVHRLEKEFRELRKRLEQRLGDLR